MAELNILEPKKAAENAIAHSKEKIRKYEKAYESLQKFKSTVRNSHENFEGANSKKKEILGPLKSIAKNNPVAEKYDRGMGNTLTGIGMRIVDLSFGGLQAMIELKLAEYYAAIEIEEAQIRAQQGVLALLASQTETADS